MNLELNIKVEKIEQNKFAQNFMKELSEALNNFDNKNQKCISTFEIQSVCKAHEDWFNVGVKIVGIFSCEKVDTDEDKKQIHTESYDTLFPYAQSVISELTTKAGMMPLILEKAPINFGEVKITND